MRILLKLAAHGLINLGATIVVLLMLDLSSDAVLVIWLSFTVADLLADYLLLTMQPSRPAHITDFFEELNNAHYDPADPADGPPGHRWVSARPSWHDDQGAA